MASGIGYSMAERDSGRYLLAAYLQRSRKACETDSRAQQQRILHEYPFPLFSVNTGIAIRVPQTFSLPICTY
jgi:hypothetical protein